MPEDLMEVIPRTCPVCGYAWEQPQAREHNCANRLKRRVEELETERDWSRKVGATCETKVSRQDLLEVLVQMDAAGVHELVVTWVGRIKST